MAFSAQLKSELTVVETVPSAATPFAAEANRNVIHDQLNETVNLNSGSTPAATAVAAFQKALTAGAATIDLTALPLTGATSQTQSFNGLKLRAAKFRNPSSNSGAITIQTGASNGYAPFGTAGVVVLSPGQSALVNYESDAAAVSSTVKNIGLSGTGTEALDVILVAGA